MSLTIVLIGLGRAGPCSDLARALSRRGHQVTYLRYLEEGSAAGTRAGPEEPAEVHYISIESLFRLHTGTLREADLIIVGSDAPYRDAVTRWVMDQACGVVAYCEVQPGGRAIRTRELPAYDFYVSCTPGASVEQRAAALEQYVSGLAVPAA